MVPRPAEQPRFERPRSAEQPRFTNAYSPAVMVPYAAAANSPYAATANTRPSSAAMMMSPTSPAVMSIGQMSNSEIMMFLQQRMGTTPKQQVVPQREDFVPTQATKSVAAVSSLKTNQLDNQLDAPVGDGKIRCTCGMMIEPDLLEYHVCNSRGAVLAQTKTAEDWTSDDEINAANKRLMEKELQTEEGVKLVEATTYGKRHASRRANVVAKLTQSILDNQDTLGTLAEMERVGYELVPNAFKTLGGEKSLDKIQLASNMLWLFTKDLKNSKAKDGECPYLQPNSQNTYVRSLVAAMNEEFDWRYSLEQDFNFQGGYNARVRTMYGERAEEWPGVFGTGSRRQIPTQNKSSQIDITVFDENNVYQHQQKTLIICGLYNAFRGSKEHAELLVANVVEGTFEAGHELEGLPWIGFNNMLDKATKLSLTNPIMRQTANCMRLPVDIDDQSSPGGSIKRYTTKLHPLQERFYCRKATAAQKSNYVRQGQDSAEMSFKQPIGVNTINAMMKDACKMVGVEVTGHGLRRISITTVVNDPSVNTEEALAFARHGSVAAQRTYMMHDNKSEMNRFRAQGLVPKKKDDGDDDTAGAHE
jgi:hypothetical protein